MSLYLPHEVTRALEAYVETLAMLSDDGDVEGYLQVSSDAWRRALIPLHIQTTPGPATTGTFSIDDSRRIEVSRGADWIRYRVDLRVQVLYLMRAADADADWRRSDIACHHLLSHLLCHTADWPPGIDVIDASSATGYTRSPTTYPDVIYCEVFAAIEFDSPLKWS